MNDSVDQELAEEFDAVQASLDERNRPFRIPHSCANRKCRAKLGDDPVTVITSRHVRKFCSVECIVEGHVAEQEWIFRLPEGSR